MRARTFCSSQYVKFAAKNVEEYLAKGDKRLDSKTTHDKSSYRPELHMSHELTPEEAS